MVGDDYGRFASRQAVAAGLDLKANEKPQGAGPPDVPNQVGDGSVDFRYRFSAPISMAPKQ